MRRFLQTKIHRALLHRGSLLFVALALIPFLVIAAAPTWWTQRGVLVSNAASDDYALANQGQLKNFANAAVAEFDQHLPRGAGDILHALVSSWSQPNPLRNDFASFNIGQLKNTSKPFYDRLITAGYTDRYPWATDGNLADDFAIANIGQLKNLFSFDLRATDLAHDTDQNGLPDWWEKYYFGHPGSDPNADPDGDGRSNLQEFLLNSDPNDYYNGVTPEVVIVGGDNQKGIVSTFLPSPIVIRISNGGHPLLNAPVTFSVIAGGAGLTVSNGDASTSFSSLTVRSDSNGLAAVFVLLGPVPDETKTIEVRAGAAAPVTVSASSFPVAQPFVAAGSYHSFDFDAKRVVWEWGANFDGQLGDGTQRGRPLPVDNSRVDNVRAIVGGYGHTIALKWDGTVWTSGRNSSGQLGDGTTNGHNVPAIVPNLSNVIAVAAGNSHSLALKSDGTVWAWGGNSNGQLGNNTTDDSPSFVEVITDSGSTLDHIVAIAAGGWHSLAVRSDGTIWAWGANWSGQLGNGTTDDHWRATSVALPASAYSQKQLIKTSSVTPAGTQSVVTVTGGGSHSLALLSNGTVLAWGSNFAGQLGVGGFDDHLTPALIAGVANATAVVAGASHTVALRDDGTLLGWGNNTPGQLGVAGSGMSDHPTPLPNLSAITSIAGGSDYTLALSANGVVWSFGANDYGQLGRISNAPPPAPTDVDADHNGFADSWELQHFGATGQSPYADNDHDGLTNLQEYLAGTDPNNPDSDGDGVPDGQDGWALDPDFSPPRLPDFHYAVVDLGPGVATALNNNSDVVGYIPRSGPVSSRGFVWSKGDRVDLGKDHEMIDINDNGQMISHDGYYFVSKSTAPAQLRMDCDPIYPQFPPDATCIVRFPNKINNSGLIVAARYDTGNNPYGNTEISVYGTNRSFSSIFGFDVSSTNDDAIMVGVDDFGFSVRAHGSAITNYLGTLPPPFNFFSSPSAVNDAADDDYPDDVVGLSASANFHYRACLWSRGKAIDLGDLPGALDTFASGINDKKQVVGGGGTYPADKAFLWQNQTMRDLNDFIPSDSGVRLYWASDINKNGCIAASGYNAQGQVHAYLLIPAELVPDFNRDGKIDDQDRNIVSEANPYRFWINDDNDQGETGGDDIPGSATPDCLTSPINGILSVDGIRDLIDFFPLYLDLASLLQAMPPDKGFSYKLKQQDAALNFVATELKPESARDFLTNLNNEASLDNAVALGGASLQQITTDGIVLDQAWLESVMNEGKGIILLEGRAPTHEPLIIEVLDSDGSKVVEIPFSINIDAVEKMYRHFNIISATGPGRSTEMGQPLNYPDTLCGSQSFVFVHGFFVSPTGARGWNAEMFKRMYWAGSTAKFVGVTWQSDEKNGTVVPDYHKNVDNAFAAAQSLSNLLRSLGPNVTVAAHSLGNVVVGSAIQDRGASPANYFMIDAAVPLEAYDAQTEPDDSMTHPDWVSYQSAPNSNYALGDRVFASEWHSNSGFASADSRKDLTWRDRFNRVGPNTYNLYSSSEDVLRKHEGNPGFRDVVDVALSGGRFSWALQEKLKGRQVSVVLGHLGSTYGGWQFSVNIFPPGIASPDQALSLSDSTLAMNPVFDPGFTLRIDPPPPNGTPPAKDIWLGAPSWIADLTDSSKGGATAQAHANQLLAEMFPARTLPAGANRTSRFASPGSEDRNFDMSVLYRNGWPSERGENQDWQHSDVKIVAYTFMHKLFEEIANHANQ